MSLTVSIKDTFGICPALFPGLPLPLLILGGRKERRNTKGVCLHYYRGVAKREEGEEDLGTRLRLEVIFYRVCIHLS